MDIKKIIDCIFSCFVILWEVIKYCACKICNLALLCFSFMKSDISSINKWWDKSSEGNKSIVRLGFYSLFIIITSYFIILFFYNKKGNDPSWLGTFGDFFGGITTPFFSFLGFVGLLITIKLQRDDLQISRKELSLTRRELARSAEAQELSASTAVRQQKLIKQQQFESTFFSLLANHEVTLKRIVEGPDSAVKKALAEIKENSHGSYFVFFNKHDGIKSYFIVLYQILKFIDNSAFYEFSDCEFSEKKKYTSLLRAYIPNEVLNLLLFNCYVDYSNGNAEAVYFLKYKSLLERYEMLEHISFASIDDILLSRILVSYKIQGNSNPFGSSLKNIFNNCHDCILNFLVKEFNFIDVETKNKLNKKIYQFNEYCDVLSELLFFIDSADNIIKMVNNELSYNCSDFGSFVNYVFDAKYYHKHLYNYILQRNDCSVLINFKSDSDVEIGRVKIFLEKVRSHSDSTCKTILINANKETHSKLVSEKESFNNDLSDSIDAFIRDKNMLLSDSGEGSIMNYFIGLVDNYDSLTESLKEKIKSKFKIEIVKDFPEDKLYKSIFDCEKIQ